MNIRDVRDIINAEDKFAFINESYHPATDSTEEVLLIDDQFTLEQIRTIAEQICSKIGWELH